MEKREPDWLEELLVEVLRTHGGRTKRGHPVGGLSVSEALVVLDYSYGAYPDEESLLEALERLERDARVAGLDTIHVRWETDARGTRVLKREPQMRYHLTPKERAA
jgi:hypothetical protein